MKPARWIPAVVACTAVLTGAALNARSQDEKEMMKKWKQVASAGERHTVLHGMTGRWDSTWRLWMGGPGAPPTETKGEAVFEKVLGGRFVRWTETASFMGSPVEHVGYWGYDNFRKHYVGTFMSSMGTSIQHAEGAADRTGKTIHVYGHLDEFLDGTVEKNVRWSLRLDTPDKMVVEVHDLDIGVEGTKVIEIEYARKQ